jgi:hypothetical protein
VEDGILSLVSGLGLLQDGVAEGFGGRVAVPPIFPLLFVQLFSPVGPASGGDLRWLLTLCKTKQNKPIDTDGYPWVSLDFHEYQCISMDIHRYPCTYMINSLY